MASEQVYVDKDGLTLYNSLIRGDITPAMDGTGSTGTSKKFARADHVHPSDTSKVDKETGKGLSTNDFTNELKSKLDGIAAGAEVNVQSDWNQSDNTADDFIKNKPTIPHTAAEVGAIATTEKGAASGVAELDASGKVPTSQLPSFVDDVIESYPVEGAVELSAGWLSLASGGAPFTPESGKIYILMEDSTTYKTNTQFRWGGTAYVKMLDGGIRAITTAEIQAIVNS